MYCRSPADRYYAAGSSAGRQAEKHPVTSRPQRRHRGQHTLEHLARAFIDCELCRRHIEQRRPLPIAGGEQFGRGIQPAVGVRRLGKCHFQIGCDIGQERPPQRVGRVLIGQVATDQASGQVALRMNRRAPEPARLSATARRKCRQRFTAAAAESAFACSPSCFSVSR